MIEQGARSRAHELALDAARKYRHVYYSVPIALLSVDQSGAVLRRNELAERLFGQALAQGRLNPLSKLIGKGETVRLLAAIRAGGSHRVELTLKVSGETRVFALDAILAAVGDRDQPQRHLRAEPARPYARAYRLPRLSG